MKSTPIVLLQWLLVLVGVVSADGAFSPCCRTHSAGTLHVIPPSYTYELDAVMPRYASSIGHDAGNGKSALMKLRGGAFVAGQEMITFGQNLAGSCFALLFTMYGFACGFAPKKSARLFYGYDDNDKTTGTFIMRMIGSFACGIGLTAAFGIASEIEALGHLPTVPELRHAMGIGILPRIVFLLQSLFVEIPSILRLNRLGLGVALLESSLLAYSLLTGKLFPNVLIKLEISVGLVLGSLLFFKPSVFFKEDATPSKHENLFTRIAASYKLTTAVLWAALWNPNINAIPSVGLASLAWVATMVHMTFVRGDVEECGSSVMAHIAMMATGIAVAAGGLRHYLIV